MHPRIVILAFLLWLAPAVGAWADDTCRRDVATLLEVQGRNKEAVHSVLAVYGETPVPAAYRQVLARLAAKLERRGPRWSLRGYKSNELNAMSSLDGTLLLSSVMWRQPSALNTDEAAAVIAHELAHVQREHGVQSECLKRDLANDALNRELALGMQNHQQELEADQDAQTLLVRAGFSAQGMRSLLQRLANAGGTGSYSHPAAKERLQALAGTH